MFIVTEYAAFKYWFNLGGQGKIATCVAVVCVYWYTGLSLGCYLENIRVRYVVDENIFPKSVCLARK